jgi:hypothetical protein
MTAVVHIREVQQLAAEAALQASELERRVVAARLDGARSQQAAREKGWLGVLSAARLDPSLTEVFAGALTQADARVGAEQGALTSVETQRRDAAQALGAAQGRLDAAQTVARRLQRRLRRRAEEARLTEAVDRLALGRWRG